MVLLRFDERHLRASRQKRHPVKRVNNSEHISTPISFMKPGNRSSLFANDGNSAKKKSGVCEKCTFRWMMFLFGFCLWGYPFISRDDKYLSASLAVRKQVSTPWALSLYRFSSLLIKLLSNPYGLLVRKDLFVDVFMA